MARLWILLVIVSVVQAIALKLDDDGEWRCIPTNFQGLTFPASIRDAAATVAYGLMKYYTGNQTGNGANLGLMPYPPYFWWESGAVWGGMIEYWHYTNDTSYNNVTSQALVSQISPTNDFMPVKQQFDEVGTSVFIKFIADIHRETMIKHSGASRQCQQPNTASQILPPHPPGYRLPKQSSTTWLDDGI